MAICKAAAPDPSLKVIPLLLVAFPKMFTLHWDDVQCLCRLAASD